MLGQEIMLSKLHRISSSVISVETYRIIPNLYNRLLGVYALNFLLQESSNKKELSCTREYRKPLLVYSLRYAGNVLIQESVQNLYKLRLDEDFQYFDLGQMRSILERGLHECQLEIIAELLRNPVKDWF